MNIVRVSSLLSQIAQAFIDMSEVIIQKRATAMRCKCGHLWLTTSKSKYPCCPRCHVAISRRKYAVILESDTTRKLREEQKDNNEEVGNQPTPAENSNNPTSKVRNVTT